MRPAQQQARRRRRPAAAPAPSAAPPAPTARCPRPPRPRSSRRPRRRPRWPSAPPPRTVRQAARCPRRPRARTATMIAAAALDPTSRHSSPAHAPPPRPMRSSQTNVSSAPGWMPGHVGDPRIRLVVEDSAGEAAERLGDVGDGRHLAQVLVAGGEPAGEAALPAVDHRQRERPRARRRPRRERQRPPRQPLRDGRSPQHRCDADQDRRGACPTRRGRSTIRRSGRRPAKLRKRSGVALISGVTMPRCRCGTTKAATSSDDGDDDRHRLPATDLQAARTHRQRR